MATGKYSDWMEEDKLTLLRGWARKGLTDDQIAGQIGIATGTLYRWKRDHKEIREAIQKGKDVIDDEAEEALIKAAIGYYFTETETYVDAKGNQRIKKIKKYAKPDTTALIFWLKNRRPSAWRNSDPKEAKIAPEKRVDNLIKLVRGA